MKIAIIVPSLHLGGGEKFAVDLSNELAKDLNNQVTLCILSKIESKMLLIQTISTSVTIISMNKESGFDYRILFKLKEFLKSNNFDIVHTHLRSMLYASWSILRIKKISFIHTFHTLVEKEVSSILYKTILNYFFNTLKVVPVAITETVLEGIHENFGKSHNNLILNGVSALKTSSEFQKVYDEVECYKRNKETSVFINLARVTNVKNQKLLISTFIKLNKNIILLIVGSLSNEPTYAKECQELASNANNIFFLGEKNNVADYMECSDALCLSSIFEGLPLSILEAMSLGKATLSTNVGGIPNVIKHNINGFLSEDTDIESYSKMINLFIESSEIDSNAIYNIFKNKYSMEICKENYYQLYIKLLKDKKS